MSTLATLRNTADLPTTAERKHNAESLLQRKLGITDSARERVRTQLVDVAIEDSPVKRDWPRRGRDEQVRPRHPVSRDGDRGGIAG
jgi:hypothetical protein